MKYVLEANGIYKNYGHPLAKSAGMADRKMEELNRLSAAGKAGGLDGN